jgi:hypothetical protein
LCSFKIKFINSFTLVEDKKSKLIREKNESIQRQIRFISNNKFISNLQFTINPYFSKQNKEKKIGTEELEEIDARKSQFVLSLEMRKRLIQEKLDRIARFIYLSTQNKSERFEILSEKAFLLRNPKEAKKKKEQMIKIEEEIKLKDKIERIRKYNLNNKIKKVNEITISNKYIALRKNDKGIDTKDFMLFKQLISIEEYIEKFKKNNKIIKNIKFSINGNNENYKNKITEKQNIKELFKQINQKKLIIKNERFSILSFHHIPQNYAIENIVLFSIKGFLERESLKLRKAKRRDRRSRDKLSKEKEFYENNININDEDSEINNEKKSTFSRSSSRNRGIIEKNIKKNVTLLYIPNYEMKKENKDKIIEKKMNINRNIIEKEKN